jgi:manganese/iron transport system permease protein
MADLLNFFLEPLNYAFIQRGMLALIIVGGVSGVIGSFVIVRGMSFFGDALAHSILPGVALSYTISGGGIGSNLFVGGLGAGILSVLFIAYLAEKNDMKEDTAIAIVFVTMFALGIAIISLHGSYAVDLTHILFGSINGISSEDLTIMAVLSTIVLLVIGLLYKEFLVISFDINLAYSLKLPVAALQLTMLVLIAVVIVASLQSVGITLMLALLTTPAATARLFVKNLHHMIFASVIIGIISGIIGFYISYYLDIPSGASIVLTMSTVFGLAVIAKSLHNARLSTTR